MQKLNLLSVVGLLVLGSAPALGQVLLGNFVSGAADTLELPVNTWSRLWTRDPDVGQAHFVAEGGPPEEVSVVHTGVRDWALGSGLPLAVKPGEGLTLTSSATVAGAGEVSLALVSRDADGKVLDWSFAIVRAPSGSSGPVTTSFTVPPGVATLEPRWVGSGAATFRVGAFKIVRTASALVASPAASVSVENPTLRVSFTPDGGLEFAD